MPSFEHVVTDDQDLRAMMGAPSVRAVKKVQNSLDAHTRAFIAQSPFLLMATSDANGNCDVSPKGDAPGFVQILDDRRIVIPARQRDRDSYRRALAACEAASTIAAKFVPRS